MNEPKLRLDQFFDQAMSLRQGAAAAEQPELDPSLWPYEDDELINEGGMKRVLRCRDRRSGRYVARAEVLRPEDSDKFLREARLTAQLQHPNIMPIYEIGARDGVEIYFTMKLVVGGDLEKLLKRLRAGDEEALRSYPLEDRLEIFSRICEAMAYAHERGVIHLDLKPANIQISAHGEVLVCDWGIARVLDEVCVDPGLLDTSLTAHELNSMTSDGYIKGTPGYMSPEQAGGHKTRKDQSSDIYSLGAIMYCLICFHKPIPGKTVEEVLAFTRRGVIQPMERFRRQMNIPVSLESICMKALETRPEARYASVKELQQDLNKYRYGFATAAEKAGFLKQFRLLIKRNRRVVSVVAAAVCVVILLTTIFVVHLSIKEGQAQNSRLRATEAQRLAEEAQFRAETAQKLAEERHQALQVEMERSLGNGRAAVPRWIQLAQQMLADYKLDEAARYADLATQYGTHYHGQWDVKIQVHFIRQQFAAAVAAAESALVEGSSQKDYYQQIIKWSRTYAARQQKDEGLSFSDWLELSEQVIAKDEYLYRWMVAGYFEQEMPMEDRLSRVRQLLILRNPGCGANLHLHEGSLDLSSQPKLVWVQALYNMPIDSLNLSDTGVASVLQLCGMSLSSLQLRNCPVAHLDALSPSGTSKAPPLGVSIEKLDLRGIPCEDFTPLQQCPKLRLLTLTAGQVKWAKAAKLPSRVQIVVAP